MWAESRFGIKAWLVLQTVKLNILRESQDHGIVKASWERYQGVSNPTLLRAGAAPGTNQVTQGILSSRVFTTFSDSNSTGFLSKLCHCWIFLTGKKLLSISRNARV